MRHIAIIPPQNLPDEHQRIWDILTDHHLEPEPLGSCAKHLFTPEQVVGLIAILPGAPIPEFRPKHDRYVMVELRSTHPGIKGFIKDTLAVIVENSSAVRPWIEGEPVLSDQRRKGCPNRRMRDIMMIVSGETADVIYPFFKNNEAEAA